MKVASPDTLSICGLAAFVTNSPSLLRVGELSVPAADVLSDILASDAEIDSLTFDADLPAKSPGLSAALKRSHVRSISFGSPSTPQHMTRLIVTAAAGLGPTLQRLCISGVEFLFSLVLSQALERCESLRTVRIARCLFTRKELFVEIIAGLGRSRSLESLSLLDNRIERDACFDELAESLGGSVSLRNLVVANQNCWEQGSKAIARKLIPRLGSKLQTLGLDNDSLGDDGLWQIIHSLVSRPLPLLLQQLSLSDNRIGPASGPMLAELVSHSPHLARVSLAGNTVGPVAASEIGEAIRKTCSRTLEYLDAAECGLGAEGVAGLLAALRVDSRLRFLDLGRNSAGDVGAQAVCSFLMLQAGHAVMEELGLQANEITETGAAELAKGLARANALTFLDISLNPLKPAGGCAVVSALNSPGAKPRMNSLKLSGCGIGNPGAMAVSQLIRGRGCRILALRANEIPSEGMAALSDAGAHTADVILLSTGQSPAGTVSAQQLFMNLSDIVDWRTQVLVFDPEQCATAAEAAADAEAEKLEREAGRRAGVVLMMSREGNGRLDMLSDKVI